MVAKYIEPIVLKILAWKRFMQKGALETKIMTQQTLTKLTVITDVRTLIVIVKKLIVKIIV